MSQGVVDIIDLMSSDAGADDDDDDDDDDDESNVPFVADEDYFDSRVVDDGDNKKAAKKTDIPGTSDLCEREELTLLFLDQMKSRCWKCQEPLQIVGMPRNNRASTCSSSNSNVSTIGSKEDDEEFCCYKMYSHPLFQVPICIVCEGEVSAVEAEVSVESNRLNGNDDDNKDGNQPSAWCSGCGTHEDNLVPMLDKTPCLLWLCESCPRATCSRCVEQANGGKHMDPDADEHAQWNCPHCDPPLSLVKLRIHHLQRMELALSLTSSSTTEQLNRRSAQDVLRELQIVEEKKRECEEMEQSDYKDDVRNEIRLELLQQQKQQHQQQPQGSDTGTGDKMEFDDINSQVEVEFVSWQEHVQRHEQRLSDMAASLQDELEISHPDISLKEFYKYIGHLPNGTNDKSTPEPKWKLNADEELAERDVQRAREQASSHYVDDPIYRKDLPEEVEDLCALDVDYDSQQEVSSEWRSSRVRATASAIAYALQCEDEILASNNILINARIDEDEDTKEMIEDEKSASREGRTLAAFKRERQNHPVKRNQRFQNNQLENRAYNLQPSSLKEKHGASGTKDSTDVSNSTSREPHHNRSARSIKNNHTVKNEVCPGALETKKNINASKPANKQRHHDRSPRSIEKKHLNVKDEVVKLSDDDIEENKGAFFDSHITTMPAPSDDMVTFRSKNPSFALSGGLNRGDSSKKRERTIGIAEPLVNALKPHQLEGVEFMFKNTFADLAIIDDKKRKEAYANIGGCILAHHMGLGKSLSCIALLHAMLHHPSLKQDNTINKRVNIHTVVLVVPVNTLANWDVEFDKWVGKLNPSIQVFALYNVDVVARRGIIAKWSKRGGVLLVGDQTFRNIVKKDEAWSQEPLQDPGPDVIILDEAHTMLKNASNQGFKVLNGVHTRRRICLTGSPFQNNLMEYFRMVSYVRPGLLGNSERDFKRDVQMPIEEGMSSDAGKHAKDLADSKLNEITYATEPFLHRKDANVLRKDLKPLQHVILHVRQTKVQTRLYGACKRYNKGDIDGNVHNNFLQNYISLRPVHNHPGCLLMPRRTLTFTPNAKGSKADTLSAAPIQKQKSQVSHSNHQPVKKEFLEKLDNSVVIDLLSDTESEEEANTKSGSGVSPKECDDQTRVPDEELDCDEKEWWATVIQRYGADHVKKIENGNKVVLLLHILVHASLLDEKVVVFSQCLKTLDYLEEILSLKDWEIHVQSLHTSFPEAKGLGGWRSGFEYLRIDGGVSGAERGDLIQEFNRELSSIRLFLISLKAGGIGINLCSANRVVLFDSTFNPAITDQAICRCYRYGQQKSVFTYRFLTQGTVEEKVYYRCINKKNLGNRVVDGKTFQRHFTKKEVEDLDTNDQWVQCDKCDRWRMFPPWEKDAPLNLPDKWYCINMRKFDEEHSRCDVPEKDEKFYTNYFEERRRELANTELSSGSETQAPPVAEPVEIEEVESQLSPEEIQSLVENDAILKSLIGVSTSNKKNLIVSKFKFHDTRLAVSKGKKNLSRDNAASEQSGIDRKPSNGPTASAKLPVSLTNSDDGSARKHKFRICHKCYKRRLLPTWTLTEKSDSPWCCNMNTWDEYNHCDADELDEKEYAKYFESIKAKKSKNCSRSYVANLWRGRNGSSPASKKLPPDDSGNSGTKRPRQPDPPASKQLERRSRRVIETSSIRIKKDATV